MVQVLMCLYVVLVGVWDTVLISELFLALIALVLEIVRAPVLVLVVVLAVVLICVLVLVPIVVLASALLHEVW